VPEGHCWLIGDNLPESRDSRTFGPLPLALIKGKIVAKLGGVEMFSWIENNLVPAEVDV
jgi:inner membrane protease subunit 1